MPVTDAVLKVEKHLQFDLTFGWARVLFPALLSNGCGKQFPWDTMFLCAKAEIMIPTSWACLDVDNVQKVPALCLLATHRDLNRVTVVLSVLFCPE